MPDTSYQYGSDTYTSGYTLGIGPVLGITFLINNRLSLSTETSIYFMKQYSKTIYEYYNEPSLNDIRIYDDLNIAINYPLFVYFEIKL